MTKIIRNQNTMLVCNFFSSLPLKDQYNLEVDKENPVYKDHLTVINYEEASSILGKVMQEHKTQLVGYGGSQGKEPICLYEAMTFLGSVEVRPWA